MLHEEAVVHVGEKKQKNEKHKRLSNEIVEKKELVVWPEGHLKAVAAAVLSPLGAHCLS